MNDAPGTGISCKIINHTADIGIRASAPTMEELFQVCALGMMNIIMGDSSFPEEMPAVEYPITIEGSDVNDLLYAFLSEVLYFFDGESIIPLSFKESKVENGKFSALMEGIPFNPEVHIIERGIKAITFCNMKIEKTEDKWQTDVIFDI